MPGLSIAPVNVRINRTVDWKRSGGEAVGNQDMQEWRKRIKGAQGRKAIDGFWMTPVRSAREPRVMNLK